MSERTVSHAVKEIRLRDIIYILFFASTVYVGLVSFAFYTQLESLFPRRALSLHNVFLKGLLRCARFELGRENTIAA